MFAYVIRRQLQSLLVLLAVSALVFALARLGGDPTPLLLPLDSSKEQVAAFRERLGLDQPIIVQYVRFLGRAVQGDLGQSLRHRESALKLVVERVPATLQLLGAALLVTVLISIPLGTLSAVWKDSLLDHSSRLFALLGQSIPSFWLGIMLMLLLAVEWRLLPASGSGTAAHLVLPAIALGTHSAAITTRLLRSTLIEVLQRDYIRTAKSKGLAWKRVVLVHAAKNASIPIVTLLGLQAGSLLGGAIITETVFAYPGMGLLAIQAIRNRDFPVVQAFVLALGIVITLLNLLIDLLYAYLDPRIRYA